MVDGAVSTSFDDDELVIAELKKQTLNGMSYRSKAAIKSLSESGDGDSIFLFVSMNARIRKLEEQIQLLIIEQGAIAQ